MAAELSLRSMATLALVVTLWCGLLCGEAERHREFEAMDGGLQMVVWDRRPTPHRRAQYDDAYEKPIG